MIMKMPHSVLSICPRGDYWNRASGTTGVYELVAMGHLEYWTFLGFLVGEGDLELFYYFPIMFYRQ